MRIKQITFYALRAIRTIYLEDSEVVTSNSIAEKESISQGVLLRILRDLSYQGILESHQGRGKICGGFSLKKDIGDITLLEIVESMEGQIDLLKVEKPFKKSNNSMYETFNLVDNNLRKELAGYSVRNIFSL